MGDGFKVGPQYDYLGRFKEEDCLHRGHLVVGKLDLGLDPSEQAYFDQVKGDERAESNYSESGDGKSYKSPK